MKSIFILLLLVSPTWATALSDLPLIRDVTYVATARDPFVDASVSPTLMRATGERDLRAVGRPIETYRTELEAVLRQNSKVNGIAVGLGGGYSVVNGKIVKPAMSLTAPINDDLAQRLLLTSRYFGLGLEAAIESKHLAFEITRITPDGLHLRLQGMKAELHLPYRKNLSPQ